VAAAAAVMLLVLAALRLGLRAPRPALLSLAAVFLLCGVVCLASPARRRSVASLASRLLLATTLVAALAASLIYSGDRSRWLWLQATGYNLSLHEDQRELAGHSLSEFLARHRWIVPDPAASSALLIPAGNHELDETVVVPPGIQLTIAPGAELRFASGCSLVCYGSLVAQGTAAQPIRLTAQRPWLKWGVLAVIDGPSARLRHVQFAHSRHAVISGVDLPGGFTALGSTVTLDHCRFERAAGKDAANLRNSTIDVRDCQFVAAAQDGLDVDGGQGTILRNQFLDCGDEGLDLSDNQQLQAQANLVRDDRGGRLAAEFGEHSLRRHNRLESHP
jgi:hypothetical protein